MAQYLLRWDTYSKSISDGFACLQQRDEFVDMTLAADGHLVKVHKNLVALSSPYIKDMIRSAPCQHPVIFLSDISHEVLSYLLEYIYTGQVKVPNNKLKEVIKAAKALHLVGLENLISNNVLQSFQKQNESSEVSDFENISPKGNTINTAEIENTTLANDVNPITETSNNNYDIDYEIEVTPNTISKNLAENVTLTNSISANNEYINGQPNVIINKLDANTISNNLISVALTDSVTADNVHMDPQQNIIIEKLDPNNISNNFIENMTLINSVPADNVHVNAQPNIIIDKLDAKTTSNKFIESVAFTNSIPTDSVHMDPQQNIIIENLDPNNISNNFIENLTLINSVPDDNVHVNPQQNIIIERLDPNIMSNNFIENATCIVADNVHIDPQQTQGMDNIDILSLTSCDAQFLNEQYHGSNLSNNDNSRVEECPNPLEAIAGKKIIITNTNDVSNFEDFESNIPQATLTKNEGFHQITINIDKNCYSDTNPSSIPKTTKINTDIAAPPLYLNSSKGALQLIFNRYLYCCHYNAHYGRKRRWRCVDYRLKKCKAYVDTVDETIVSRKFTHEHGFHDEKILEKGRNTPVFSSIAEILQAKAEQTAKVKKRKHSCIEND